MAENPEDLIVTDAELRRQLPALAEELKIGGVDGSVPIFATLAEAEAWEAANPGKKALTLEPSTPDTTPPTWAATLTVGTPTDKQVVVTASALASDDRVVAGYEVTYNGTTWSAITPSGKNFTLTGLTPATAYGSVKLRAEDTAGNASPALAVPAFTTAATPVITTSAAPEQIAGLWMDYNAALPASVETYAGGRVSKLLDTTSGARHMVAAAEGTAPEVSSINGKRAVRFTAASSTRLRHAGSFTQGTPWTLAVVLTRESATPGAVLDTIGARIELNGNGYPFGRVGSAVTSGITWESGARLLALSHDGTTLSITDGLTTKTVAAADSVLTNNFALGAAYGGAGTLFTDVTVGRVSAWNRALTSTEIAELHNWAKTEWGVA